MNVKLLTSSQTLHDMEYNAALAALTCRTNTDKEFVPSEVLKRRIKENHGSVLEHINLTYSIEGLSRACLQELARHRIISLSVESTRHTLRKKLSEEWNELITPLLGRRVPEISFDNKKMDLPAIFLAFLISLNEQVPDFPNDEMKYYLPEFWPTNLILTSNIRELRHILNLRTAHNALREFRVLAHGMFEVVPEAFKYLLQDCVHTEVYNE